MLGNRNTCLITVTANQDFDHVGHTAMFESRSLAHGLFYRRIVAHIAIRVWECWPCVAARTKNLRYGFDMTLDYLTQHWALLLAGILGAALALFILYRAFQDSTRGRLQAAVRNLHDRERNAETASKVAARAHTTLDGLNAKADSVRPRHVEEASETLEDARALQKIANDQVMIARNQVRKIILQEYPPKQHEAMRRKYLSQDE